MKCIACFSEDDFQKELKRKCFGINRFENKITRYKELYINEIKNLISVSKCDCAYRSTSAEYIKWNDDLLQNLQRNINIIESTFDELREIYLCYISQSNKIALDRFWSFLNENNLLMDSEGALSYTRLLFRARKNDGIFDTKDIKELFHIPFSKRHLIGNQRFSITGQPMLYLSNSVFSIEKELNESYDNLSFAAFLPKYYLYYGHRIYEIKNMLFNLLYKSLPAIFESGSRISYFDNHVTPNHSTIIIDIKKTILSHILTFPTEQKGTFIPEYVLPQMITAALLEHDYKGIVFPSTKDFSDWNTNKLNNDHEINIAFFVNYNHSQDLDTDLLNSFFYFTFDGSENFTIDIKDIKSGFEQIIDRNRKSDINNNDFIIPLVNANMHIDNLKTSRVKGIEYFETKSGKTELELYLKMANELDKYVK